MEKKLLAFMLACSLALPATATAVLAANTSDTAIDFDVNALNFNVKTGKREKQNSTAVYCLIDDLEDNSRVLVRALGCTADNEVNKTTNGTTGILTDYVTLRMGVQYSIHSNIYEDGYRGARLAFKSLNHIFSEHVHGVWSPDSTRPYTDAWK